MPNKWKLKESELARPHFIQEYIPKQRKKSKFETFHKKITTFVNSDYDTSFGDSSKIICKKLNPSLKISLLQKINFGYFSCLEHKIKINFYQIC